MTEKTITRSDIRFWVFLMSIVVICVAWGTRMETKVEAMDIEMHEEGRNMQDDLEEAKTTYGLIQIQLAEIKVQLENIEKKLE